MRTCQVLGCNKVKKRRSGYCSMHRARLSRTGRLDKVTPFERIMKKTRQSGECIEYTGPLNKGGYGRCRVNNIKTLVHRHVYEVSKCPIPNGMLVCHKCDNPSCIKIEHLFLGTHYDNCHDAMDKGRKLSLKGENHGMHKLTICDILIIRGLQKMTYKQIAIIYNVTISNIHMIRKRKSWKHIPK